MENYSLVLTRRRGFVNANTGEREVLNKGSIAVLKTKIKDLEPGLYFSYDNSLAWLQSEPEVQFHELTLISDEIIDNKKDFVLKMINKFKTDDFKIQKPFINYDYNQSRNIHAKVVASSDTSITGLKMLSDESVKLYIEKKESLNDFYIEENGNMVNIVEWNL